MNGATAEPWLKIISPPNKARTIIIGNNQNFFRTIRNFQNSIKKLILKLVLHTTVSIVFIYPIGITSIFF